jgi:LysR family transcriptional regulator, glycine cleavage system transcriptional activator
MILRMRRAWTPTLPELQAFAEVARTGSATAAAAGLGLTQSAISRALATLEARLGTRLFRRERQRLVLSDAGRAFWPEAAAILDRLEAAALQVMAFGGRTQVLRGQCLPSFATAWLIPRLAAFQGAHPDVTFDISATLGAVDLMTHDFAILRGTAPTGTEVQRLCDEVLVAVAAPGFVGPHDDLGRLPLLQQATRPDLWPRWFGDVVPQMRGARFEQFGMVMAAARAGLGVALVPEVLAEVDLAAGTLVAASARRMATDTPYILCWPPRAVANPAFKALLAALTGTVAPPGQLPAHPPVM